MHLFDFLHQLELRDHFVVVFVEIGAREVLGFGDGFGCGCGSEVHPQSGADLLSGVDLVH